MPKGQPPAVDTYDHVAKRLNNPQVGSVNPHTDPDSVGSREWNHDYHIDPHIGLCWTGKEPEQPIRVDVRSLHIHERVEPIKVLEAVREHNSAGGQPPMFDHRQLRGAQSVQFYQHAVPWTNRMIAGDSLLVMTSLLEKENMGGQIQTIYMDPPYGIEYKSNFQPFINSKTVKDKQDITHEPEMVKAFQDTWELGIHSYLTYMRDRLLLCRELLAESGSCFVQAGDDNFMRVGLLLDEIFGAENRVTVITYRPTTSSSSSLLPDVSSYLIWYAKNKVEMKYHQLYEKLDRKSYLEYAGGFCRVEEEDGSSRILKPEEKNNPNSLPDRARLFQTMPLTSQNISDTGRSEPYFWNGKKFDCPARRQWSVSKAGLDRLSQLRRLYDGGGGGLSWRKHENEYPGIEVNNIWPRATRVVDSEYVVETSPSVIERCLLMTSDPGDLVFDPTCGSGTTAYVAEDWGRRWITCDTSRIALTLARKRLLTAVFPYYTLLDNISPAGGFIYEEIEKLSAKILAYDEPRQKLVFYDRPQVETKIKRVSGAFTIEALPAPYSPHPVLSIDELTNQELPNGNGNDEDWRDWMDRMRNVGVRTRHNGNLLFSYLGVQPGSGWINAVGETNEGEPVAVIFGPKYAPLSVITVERAVEEAQELIPTPKIVLFVAFQFDPEAAKTIDRKNWPGVQLLRATINTELLVSNLKKSHPSDDIFWLIGQPDIGLEMNEDALWSVRLLGFDYFNPHTGQIESGDETRIAVWSLDTNYDGKSLFPTQVFFPLDSPATKRGWGNLAKNLKGAVDKTLIQYYIGNTSLPFQAGDHQRIAVRVVDDRGVESLKILDLKTPSENE